MEQFLSYTNVNDIRIRQNLSEQPCLLLSRIIATSAVTESSGLADTLPELPLTAIQLQKILQKPVALALHFFSPTFSFFNGITLVSFSCVVG